MKILTPSWFVLLLSACQMAHFRPLYSDLSYRQRLSAALVEQIHYLEIKKDLVFTVGKEKIGAVKYRQALIDFKNCYEQGDQPHILDNCLDKFFWQKRVEGKTKPGNALVTGYYLPQLKASKRKSKIYSRPVYSLPEDKLQFLDRHAIDIGLAYADKKLELAYLTPIDAYILHIQGSGILQFEDGSTLLLGHAGNNQKPYQSLGKLLEKEYPIEQMNWPWIENYLAHLSPTELDLFLAKNPRYIFFRVLPEFPRTTTNTNAFALITGATDPTVLPLGMMAIISLDENLKLPAIPADSLLILMQDTGGGIKGPGRIDLYLGLGAEAKQSAEHLRSMAKMMVLIPK